MDTVADLDHNAHAISSDGSVLVAAGGGDGGEPEAKVSSVRPWPGTKGVLWTTVLPSGTSAHAVAVAGDSVWVVDPAEGRLWRLTTAGEIVGSVAVDGRPTSVAVSPGRVWMTAPDTNVLTRHDIASGASTSTPLDDLPCAVAAGFGWVWVALCSQPTILQIDAETLTTFKEHTLRSSARRLFVDDRHLWAATGGGVIALTPVSDVQKSFTETAADDVATGDSGVYSLARGGPLIRNAPPDGPPEWSSRIEAVDVIIAIEVRQDERQTTLDALDAIARSVGGSATGPGSEWGGGPYRVLTVPEPEFNRSLEAARALGVVVTDRPGSDRSPATSFTVFVHPTS